MYGAMQDDSSDEESEEGEEEENKEGEEKKEEAVEEEDEEVIAMFDYDKNDLDWRVDQQVFQPLRDIFGFQDTRDTEE